MSVSMMGNLAVMARAMAALLFAPVLYCWCRLRQLKAGRDSGRQEVKPLQLVFLRTDFGVGRFAGGAFGHLFGLCQGLTRLGHRICVLSNEPLPGLELKGVEVEIARGAISPPGLPLSVFLLAFNWTCLRQCLSLARRFRPDFIYQRHSILNITGALVALALRVPFLLEYNSPAHWKREADDKTNALLAPLNKLYERLNLVAASRVFVVSDVLQEMLLRKGVPPGKIIVNPNGADIEAFSPSAEGGDVRTALNLADKFVVGFSGYYGPYHGVEYLARCARDVIECCPDARFLFIGDERLKQVVSGIGREQNTLSYMIFLEHVPYAEMPRHLAACDVLVSPHVNMADKSRFFGSPVKLFEYMAMGKPIVASRIEQLGRLLVHEREALLVEPADPEQISQAIGRLWRDPDLRIRLGAAAREKCAGAYSWVHNAKRVLDGYAAVS